RQDVLRRRLVVRGDKQPDDERDEHGGELVRPVPRQPLQEHPERRPSPCHELYASLSALRTSAGAMSLDSTPSRATLTVPRSSLTTTTSASLTSDRPSAARWRVPCLTDQPSCLSDR